MQFRLITLFIITGIVCVYCAVLNLPAVIAFPLFCAVAWLSPAYFISGVIYMREARRAFFIGGLASGALPFLGLALYSLGVVFDGRGPWGYRGGWGRTGFGETQLVNLFASLVIFSPVIMAFFGGWVSMAVYYSAQPKKPVPPPASPFRPMTQPANEQPLTPIDGNARDSSPLPS
ncbi:MAG: hypothetical protein ACKVP0_27455 [Pirellulaceae bacterium]